MNRTDERFDALSKRYGGLSDNLGFQAEEFFYQGLKQDLEVGGIRFDSIERNFKVFGKEYDILLINGDTLMLISVKYRLHHNDMFEFLQKDVPAFKKFFPQYQDYKIYAGMATFSMGEGVDAIVQEQGCYLFTQSGDHPQLLNAPDFQAKLF
ncbi:MAG: hypothetical protein HQL94_09135 [Magnetococcales bacterium]|nr:hypothetical protein [Magnetococcales bacterium]